MEAQDAEDAQDLIADFEKLMEPEPETKKRAFMMDEDDDEQIDLFINGQ